MPMAPQECIEVPGTEAVDSLGHRALERKPPHFAVGHDVEPRCLLEGDGLIDGAILYGLELRVIKTPGHPVITHFAQRNRPHKTANHAGLGGTTRSYGGRERRAPHGEIFAFCPLAASYCGKGKKIPKPPPRGWAEAADSRPP